MRGSLLLTAAAFLASSTFAQSAKPAFPPVATDIAPANAMPSNYQFHAQFGTDCCATDFGLVGAPESAPASGNAVAPASARFAYAAGGPDFQPSNYAPFRDAVAQGDEQAAHSPFAQSRDATVRQMLDLIQASRAAEQQNYNEEGADAPVRWADVQSGINPSGYLRPPSSYLKYKDAVSRGKQEAQAGPPQPSLGEVAAAAKDERPADAKPAVGVRQDADVAPRVIHRGEPAPAPQQPAANSQPQ